MFSARNLQRWQESTQEEVLEPELMIIDPHHHLWNPLVEPRGPLTSVSKITSRLPTGMGRKFVQMLYPKELLLGFSKYQYFTSKYVLTNLRNDFGGHKVVKTVLIEAGLADKKRPVEEENVPESLTAKEEVEQDPDFDMHVVAYVDLKLGKEKVLAGIEAHKKANEKVVGIRHQMAWHENNTVMNALPAVKEMSKLPAFRESIEALIEKEMSFDAWCHFTQLDEVATLAADFPDLQIILDHVGGPVGVGIYSSAEAKEKMQKDWEIGMKNVAQHPNVVCKISGMTMPVVGLGFEKKTQAPTSDEVVEGIFPYVQTTVEIFGVDRCMFASNFPVDRVSVSYVVLYNAFKKCCQKLGLSEEDKKKIFYDNAAKVYKFNKQAEPAVVDQKKEAN